MKETPLLLHVGLEKTGSSTLQETLLYKHPQVHYLGKIKGNDSKQKSCLDEITYRILDPILWNLDEPMNTEATLALFHDKLLPSVSEDQILVGSWEGLGSQAIKAQIEMLNRTQAIFGGCRIMITLRNPLSRLPSLYLQNLYGNFMKQKKGIFDSHDYVDIETWFSKRMSNEKLFTYVDFIQSSIEQLGRENVGIFLFEELKEDPNAYYKSICEFMGIDSEIGVSLTQNKHVNPRMSEEQLTYMHSIQSSFFKRSLNSFRSVKSRKNALRAKKSGPPAKVILTDHIIQKVSDASREGHRWLVENLNLPLERYGYPL
ncbi:MAG: sulfotransferase domain-containing protein [Lentisphaeria bacterium]|nr:sulfotransferase domain-containing protein [Lentisphaeria bacterium]NQZ66448.1 sulfotransferase domain-containing protein [Lentisphaeria bacterium]